MYRGQLDDSRPGSNKPLTGRDLRAAIDAALAGQVAAVSTAPLNKEALNKAGYEQSVADARSTLAKAKATWSDSCLDPSGTCPSAFTTGALADGASATPALTGAQVGSACAIKQADPGAVSLDSDSTELLE